MRKLLVLRILFVFSVAALTLTSFFGQTSRVVAAPFTCDSTFYQLINGSLTKLDPNTGVYDSVGYTGSLVTNAAGYNTEDNYMYGWQTPNWGGVTGIVRIEDDATTTLVGMPADLPVASYVSGDFDHSGNLYLYSGGGSVTLWQIDVSASPEPIATPITLTRSLDGINDLVFVDGSLYGLGISGGTVALYRVDPISGSVTLSNVAIEPDPSTPGSVYGAGWAADNSKLFFARNSDGMIFELTNFDGAAPSATPVLSGQSAASNDGVSCGLARSPIPPLVANDDVYQTAANATTTGNVLSNDTGRQISVTSYTQATNGSVLVNPDGSYSYTPRSGFSGTDTFTYTITDEYGVSVTATVTITVGPAAVELAATGSSQTVVLFASIVAIAGGILAGFRRYTLV